MKRPYALVLFRFFGLREGRVIVGRKADRRGRRLARRGAPVLCAALCAGAYAQQVQGSGPGEDWNLRLQSTYVWQAKPGFDSPYAGPHSLRGDREKSYSFSATAALGLRLGPATEVYVDPEVTQGVPLSGLLGLAGFTNGEMARTSGSNPTFYRARLFVRHTLALGEETEAVESAMNQLGGRQAPRRLVFTLGNVSVLDIFDANKYDHDPRTQFMNWTVMTHGAYDFPADARGYTWGAAVEYVQPGWALRAGRFAQPERPNGLSLDFHLSSHYGDQVELEIDHELLPGRPGAVRLLAFHGRAVMARYADALALSDASGGVPSLDAARQSAQDKLGAGVNIEQPLGDHLGAFARAMWADGKTETYAFTEADRSLSYGLSADGSAWQRGGDSVGLAISDNFLSGLHRQVLQRGGQTFFLGDGRLSYSPERIAETHYTLGLAKGLTVSLDLQRIVHPGYNADRGPASFAGLRLHSEY